LKNNPSSKKNFGVYFKKAFKHHKKGFNQNYFDEARKELFDEAKPEIFIEGLRITN
jgi:hypothetical protein